MDAFVHADQILVLKWMPKKACREKELFVCLIGFHLKKKYA